MSLDKIFIVCPINIYRTCYMCARIKPTFRLQNTQIKGTKKEFIVFRGFIINISLKLEVYASTALVTKVNRENIWSFKIRPLDVKSTITFYFFRFKNARTVDVYVCVICTRRVRVMFADETESVNIAILSMSQRSPTFSNEFRKRQKRYYADHLLLSYISRYSHCTRTRLEQLTSVVDKSRAGYISRFSRDDNIINKANVRYDPIVIPINEEKLVQTYNRHRFRAVTTQSDRGPHDHYEKHYFSIYVCIFWVGVGGWNAVVAATIRT